MAPTIAFIGAGSTVFAKNLLGDILSFEELGDVSFRLFDIDAERLKTSEAVAHRVAATLGVTPRIEATTDRRRALDGADYAINMIQVGGYKPSTVIDFEIPTKHGLRQTIADTLGIGGIMRALRTIPVVLDMARDMEALCPDVLLLNYTNPMAMLCTALNRGSSIETVGLCHSVPLTASQLGQDLGIEYRDLTYFAAGINHMAFYLRFERDGEDLYPALREIAQSGRAPENNRVRYDLLRHFGYFVTESSEHFAEYVPWYIKRDRPDLIERFRIPLDEYPRRCEAQIAGWQALRDRLEGDEPLKVVRSPEYGSRIIHARETGKTRVVYGNVANNGIIDNLPSGITVEVPCVVDRSGLHPMHVGSLPVELAALIQTNVNVQTLTVEAALTGRRDHVVHAALLDPHTAAELDPDQIVALVDELLAAHGQLIPALA